MKTFFTAVCLCLLGVAQQSHAADYQQREDVDAFVAKMVKEHGFKKNEIEAVLNRAEKKQAILDAISRPAEKTKPWFEYKQIFLGQDRIDQGVTFWQENKDELAQAEKKYGVEAQIIVAIIGVETRYGKYMGSYRVVDALATLGFDYPPRAPFFISELEQLFLLTREQKLAPLALKGSYAGAMGYGQFIPSSYRNYAVDFDRDGSVDILTNKKDAIGSVANYFKAHGWQTGAPVFAKAKLNKPIKDELTQDKARPSLTLAKWAKLGVVPAKPFSASKKALLLKYEQVDGPEYWFGFNNFYVITRYNRSPLYAMAVWQLSNEIRSAMNKKTTKNKR